MLYNYKWQLVSLQIASAQADPSESNVNVNSNAVYIFMELIIFINGQQMDYKFQQAFIFFGILAIMTKIKWST